MDWSVGSMPTFNPETVLMLMPEFMYGFVVLLLAASLEGKMVGKLY